MRLNELVQRYPNKQINKETLHMYHFPPGAPLCFPRAEDPRSWSPVALCWSGTRGSRTRTFPTKGRTGASLLGAELGAANFFWGGMEDYFWWWFLRAGWLKHEEQAENEYELVTTWCPRFAEGCIFTFWQSLRVGSNDFPRDGHMGFFSCVLMQRNTESLRICIMKVEV